MLDNVALGSYVKRDSVIHDLNPVAKIIALIILLIGIFLINDIWLYVVSTIFIFLLLKIAKLSILGIVKSLRGLAFMFIFLFILNIFLIKTGNVLFEVWNIKVFSGAIQQTVLIFLRIASMVFVTSLLTLSTKPLDLTFGIEQILSPLKKIHFPAHEIAMMISIALRFIPTLIEEANKIMIAQTSRGVDFESGKLKTKIPAIISLLVPLFVSSFKRAEDLANAMDARGYNPLARRTRYIEHKWTLKDTLAIVISLIYTGVIIWYAITK